MRLVIKQAQDDHANAPRNSSQWVFFDRGLVDAAAALQAQTVATLGQSYRYHSIVFLTPLWPEIYVQDAERRHGLDTALVEYKRLLQSYPALGDAVSLLPKASVVERAVLLPSRGRFEFLAVVSGAWLCQERWPIAFRC